MILINKSTFYGINSYKSHPELLMFSKQDDSHFSNHHAELDALLRAKRVVKDEWQKHLRKAKLFVCRVDRQGNLAMARPCQYCYQYILDQGFQEKNIFYTNDQGQWKTL